MKWISFSSLAVFALALVSAAGFAQESEEAKPEAAKSDTAQPVDPRPQQWLGEWVRAAEKQGPFKATFRCVQYDSAAAIASLSECTLRVESPERWRVDAPAKLPTPATSVRNGITYQWWLSERLLYARERESLFVEDTVGYGSKIMPREYGIPPELNWPQYRNGFLDLSSNPGRWLTFPHLNSEQFSAYTITVREPGPPKRWLVFQPADPKQRQFDWQIDVIFDDKLSLPAHVRILEPSENKETIFINMKYRELQSLSKIDREGLRKERLNPVEYSISRRYPLHLAD